MTAVAVWGNHPSADELLEYRLSKGWKPTPSRLKEGDKVEGHAACTVDHAETEAQAGVDA